MSSNKILEYQRKRNKYLKEFDKIKNITNDNVFFIKEQIDMSESMKESIELKEKILSDLEADLFPTSQEQKDRLRKELTSEIDSKKVYQEKLQNEINNYINKNETILELKHQYYKRILELNKLLDDSSSLRVQSSNLICPICQENIDLHEDSIKCPNQTCQVYYHKYCIRDYCRNADKSYIEQYEVLDENDSRRVIEDVKNYPKVCPICRYDWDNLCDRITIFKKSSDSAFNEFTGHKQIFKNGGKKKSKKKIKRKKSSKRRFKR